MKLFKFGKKNKGYRCTQYGLFSQIDFNTYDFIHGFERDWGIKLEAEIHNENNIISLSFKIEDIEFVCSFMKGMYPDELPIKAAQRNPFWREAEECVRNHKSFMIVGILKNDCMDMIKTCSIFTQVCCSLMATSNALCMYNADSGMIIEKNTYRNNMNIMQAALKHGDYYLPHQNWINVNYVREEDGQIGAYTTGLNIFNKLEIELVHVKYDIEIMQKIIGMILFGLIMDNRTLDNGQVINLDEDIEIMTRKTKGYYLSDRQVIQIYY